MTVLDFTHEPTRLSFVDSANSVHTDFPIQNLPFGIFSKRGEPASAARGGVAIGDWIVDLQLLAPLGLLDGDALLAAKAASGSSLNGLMALGSEAIRALRNALSAVLASDASRVVRARVATALVPQAEAVMHLPAKVGAFTDFFTSAHHASRAGRISRPDQPLPPAFQQMPMGYNGRASAVRVGGADMHRPWGILQGNAGQAYRFGPTEALDFELELGAYIGRGTAGEMLELDQARDRLFGLSLLNDWSSRDVQRAESFPLGPFLSKSALTSVSPWIVTMDALAPFRSPVEKTDRPEAPAHLLSARHSADGAMAISLTMSILTSAMRNAGAAEQVLTSTDARNLYWSFEQMLTHHATAGCALDPGDLMGSGTVSGPEPSSAACLYELCITPDVPRFDPLVLANGETRQWLQDGDEVILRGWAERPGARRIGFGECRTRIQAALPYPTPSN